MAHGLKEWARMGAEARLQEIEREAALIRKQFPGIGSSRPAAAPRVKRQFSAAMRKATSDRMKAFWAARKAAGARTLGTKKK
jgi:hypothetical protein